MLRHVDLCSGIGGFALGFEWAKLSTPVQFCDIEPWSRKILAKHWPHVPIATDVKELANDPERLVRECDIITAGYPCQPFSVAGRQKGEEDPRHIYPYISKIIASKRPSWVVFENVGGHIALGLDKVLADLALKDYATRVFIIPAASVGAPHKRDRLWIIGRNVGDSKHNGSSATEIGGINEENARRASEGKDQTEQSQGTGGRGHNEDVPNSESQRTGTNDEGIWQRSGRTGGGEGTAMAHTISEGLEGRIGNSQGGERQILSTEQHNRDEVWSASGRYGGENREGQEENVAHPKSEQSASSDNRGEQRTASESEQRKPRGSSSWGGRGCNWAVEPNVGRVAHGVPRRVDRIKGLGNAIVPQIAMKIGLAIKQEIEK
tara:strand:- start:117 stop:1250 length:1134 start_codon:yes stop_codon:yes gene_type:complete